jgi:hypothetical protein
MRIRASKKRKKQASIKRVPIDKIVPGERDLDRKRVTAAKEGIERGEWDHPKLIRSGASYFARDGNHRIMAAKQLGRKTVLCVVQEAESKTNVADFSLGDMKDALEKGHKGFRKMKLVSSNERRGASAQSREADDDADILDDLLGAVTPVSPTLRKVRRRKGQPGTPS